MICELLCGEPFHTPPSDFLEIELTELEWWAERAIARLKRDHERMKSG